MQQLLDLWKTTAGKVTVLGGGGLLALLSLCFVCAICGAIFGDDDSSPVAQRDLVSFTTESPTVEPTATMESTATPEPTATAVPLADTSAEEQSAPVATSTLEPDVVLQPVVSAGEANVNMRSGPGTEYEVMGQLAADQSLEIVGQNGDASWWQVNAPDGLCWVAASVTTANNVDGGIPVVEAPPLPVQEQPAGAVGWQEAQVVEVVDGDTIKVLIDGDQYTVRYILIDTPETKHPQKGLEPFGPEASAANAELVAGQTVRLEKDVNETDQYGRLLRYVYVGDMMVNEELLRRGLAQVATFPSDVKYVDRFLAVEQEARAAGAGFWAEAGVEASADAPVAPSGSEPPVGSGLLAIVALDKRAEYADIQNTGSEPVDLSGWHLLSEKGAQDCPLGGVMQPGEILRVWAMAEDAGEGGFNCDFGTNIWNNQDRDPAILFDPNGVEISRLE